MIRLPHHTALGAVVAAFLCASGTVSAQTAPADSGSEKVNQLIIYGDDSCPPSTDAELVICVRKDEQERFRIPEPLRGIGQPQSEAWANKVQAYETVGAFGINSCSPVGAGGSLGCTQRLIEQAKAERANGSGVRFGELIAEQREKRLSSIDEDAAAQQARVEEAEKAYFEQLKRQDAAAQSTADSAPLPTVGK